MSIDADLATLKTLVEVQSAAALRIERAVEKSIEANDQEHKAMWRRIDAKAEASKVAAHEKVIIGIVLIPFLTGSIWAVMEWIKAQTGGGR